jgi:hypothetical protein
MKLFCFTATCHERCYRLSLGCLILHVALPRTNIEGTFRNWTIELELGRRRLLTICYDKQLGKLP